MRFDIDAANLVRFAQGSKLCC